MHRSSAGGSKACSKPRAALGAWSVNLADRIADRETVDSIRANGYECLVYTVNVVERAAALRAMGVGGVFSGLPGSPARLDDLRGLNVRDQVKLP